MASNELIKKHVALAYCVPRVTSAIDEDIKLIKKLNSIFQRMEKSGKDVYILEAINTIRILMNIMHFNSLYLILCELIDFRYHSTVNYLLEEAGSFDLDKASPTIKKLQKLAQDTQDDDDCD